MDAVRAGVVYLQFASFDLDYILCTMAFQRVSGGVLCTPSFAGVCFSTFLCIYLSNIIFQLPEFRAVLPKIS